MTFSFGEPGGGELDTSSQVSHPEGRLATEQIDGILQEVTPEQQQDLLKRDRLTQQRTYQTDQLKWATKLDQRAKVESEMDRIDAELYEVEDRLLNSGIIITKPRSSRLKEQMR